MFVHYAPDLWRLFGVPYDRIGRLKWSDFEALCRQVEQVRAHERRQQEGGL